MKIKILALATLALVSIGSAHANVTPIAPATLKTVKLGLLSPQTDQNLSFISVGYSGYSEAYTFTTAKAYNLKTSSVELAAKKTDLINNTTKLYQLINGTYTAVPTDSYAFNKDSITDTFTGLVAGSYELLLTGTNTIKDATTISLITKLSKFTPQTISAVPEPETYAMLLAGLGLMGFMSRRCKSS